MGQTSPAQDSTELPAHVEKELEKSNSARLRRKVRTVYKFAQKAKQEKEIDIDVQYNDSDLTSLTVQTPEEKRTSTSESVHFVLGPRGGLRTAHFWGFATDQDIADKNNAWWYIKQRFRRMR